MTVIGELDHKANSVQLSTGTELCNSGCKKESNKFAAAYGCSVVAVGTNPSPWSIVMYLAGSLLFLDNLKIRHAVE